MANLLSLVYTGISYQGAKSSYKTGVEVKLYYKNFMPDRECSFYLDDEYIPLEFDTRGAVIRFVMPEHDVKLECRTRDSMSPRVPAYHDGAATSEPAETASAACPECGTAITGDMKFCMGCGRKIDRCPECDGVITGDMKFCPECGINLQHEQAMRGKPESVKLKRKPFSISSFLCS